jgi:multicomponent Na+:H+ antiporter subunit D
MSHHAPVLCVIVPLVTGLLVGLIGPFWRKASYWIAVVGLFAMLLATVDTAAQVWSSEVHEVQYRSGNWNPPWGIELRIDGLNAIVLVAIAAVALFATIAARRDAEEQFTTRLPAFYATISCLVAGLAGITATGDAFNMYVLLEITSITGYALIGACGRRGPMSAFRYIVMGTIGASFYLLGVGYL